MIRYKTCIPDDCVKPNYIPIFLFRYVEKSPFYWIWKNLFGCEKLYFVRNSYSNWIDMQIIHWIILHLLIFWDFTFAIAVMWIKRKLAWTKKKYPVIKYAFCEEKKNYCLVPIFQFFSALRTLNRTFDSCACISFLITLSNDIIVVNSLSLIFFLWLFGWSLFPLNNK